MRQESSAMGGVEKLISFAPLLSCLPPLKTQKNNAYSAGYSKVTFIC